MLDTRPCDGYIRPFRIFGNLYFVGTYPSSVHLIDTGEGLILIDTGYLDNLYLTVNNIWELGFNPKDIKYILLSHGHYDHVNGAAALAALTGAKTFIGAEDLPLVSGAVNHFPTVVYPFIPDELLYDKDEVVLGNTKILCLSTPGHTDGTMSFFFHATDGANSYRVGMFGGAGTNTLTEDFIVRNALSMENRNKFFNSIERLKKEQVEIFIGNHVGNNDTAGKQKLLEISEQNPFIDGEAWGRFLDLCRQKLEKIIKKEKEVSGDEK